MKRLALFLLLAASLLTIGCISTNALQQQAAFELGCEDLRITEISQMTYAVEGCGCRATYICNYSQERMGCDSWTTNALSGTCGTVAPQAAVPTAPTDDQTPDGNEDDAAP